MAALRYKDEHNKVGYLLKPIKSDDYHQIIDFLRSSHIRYALTTNPIIFDSLVKQFWSTATLKAPELGPPAILATIDKTPYTITEDLFSPQWRFLVHTLLYCLSTKSGSWDQFGSPLAVALIYLSDGRHFNWSSYIFKGMVSNIGNAKKFLMCPRFLQTIETRVTRHYKVLVFSNKLFANMRLNFAGHPIPLLPAMLLQAQAAHLPTPSRPQTSNTVALVLEHGYSFALHTTFVSQSHETDAGPFTTVEDAPMGGDFHTSPPRSSYAPPAGQPSRGEEDPITLTALSSVISNLVQKVHTLESNLYDHKRLFKDVVENLVKKVKTLEVKPKTKKRKMVVMTVDSDIPSGSSSQIPAASPSIPSVVPPAKDGGIADLPIVEIYFGMDHLGYVTKGKLTFFKNKFSPQWRFLVHTLLYCLSTKSGSWDQFGSPLAVALIYLSDGRHFNWSSYIFKGMFWSTATLKAPELGPPAILATIDQTPYTITEDLGMVSNIGNAKKFLMCPRFLQTIETRVTRHYKVLVFSNKLFANMRLNFAGHPIPLLPAMLLQAQAAHLPTPSRLQTSNTVALVLEHGYSFAPHTTFVFQSHETDAGPFITVEDAPMGGDFHTSPPRSSYAPPAGQPSRGCSGEFGQKGQNIGGQTKDQEKENGSVTVDSDIPSGSSSQIPAASLSIPSVVPPGALTVLPGTIDVLLGTTDVSPGTFDVPLGTSAIPTAASTVLAGSLNVHTDVPSSAALLGVSSKGKSPMVEEEIPVKAMTFKQLEEDRLVPTLSIPEVPLSPAVSSPPSSRIRRKSLGRKHILKPKSTLPKLDLDAEAQSFINVAVNEDSDNEGFDVWQNQNLWEIRSWRLYTLSNDHVLETVSGEVLSMFMDVFYPLSVKLMERMLMHKLEIDSDIVRNDMTIAEQLIQFIKNQLVGAQAFSV
nr:synaptobrevin, longin-like domain protein [Tanacetum cinerariifolium]